MKKNFAVIGYGGQGGWHTRQILASDVAALTGIYDIDPKKAELAEKNGIHAYASYDEVLADTAVGIFAHQPRLLGCNSRAERLPQGACYKGAKQRQKRYLRKAG